MSDEQHPDVEHAFQALGELQAIDADDYSDGVRTVHDRAVEITEDLLIELQNDTESESC